MIGDGTQIWQFCNIMHDSVIGKNCRVGQGVFIENGVKVGNGVKIKNNVSLYNGVICEDDVFLGPNCVFTNVLNPRSFIEKKDEFKITLIKKGATIGANATILCGNTIGRYALVGAGAVVTVNVPDHALVIGNPGRVKGYVCRCGETLDDHMKCSRCSKQYLVKDGIVTEEK
ncbi:MAG: N-acetyltransferase [Lachnospiraceae bacterium]|nr:N-acetyltransferase [Lachnospiraceae bacterium]